MDCNLFAARVLWAWLEAGHSVLEVWTSRRIPPGFWRRDRRLGWVSPRWSFSAAVSRWRLALRVVDRINDPEIAAALARPGIHVVISVSFPLILPSELLSRLSVPALNLHPALLPAYRGPTPSAAMFLDQAVNQHGGVTLHRIVPEIDAGAVFGAVRVPLPADRNPRRWELDIARAAANLAVETIPGVVAGKIEGKAQDESAASYKRTTAADFTVTPAVSGARIEWLTTVVGRTRPVGIDIDGRPYEISRIVKRLGPPSGSRARIGWTTLDLDLADGRYRLRRRPVWEGRKQRWSTMLLRILVRG